MPDRLVWFDLFNLAFSWYCQAGTSSFQTSIIHGFVVKCEPQRQDDVTNPFNQQGRILLEPNKHLESSQAGFDSMCRGSQHLVRQLNTICQLWVGAMNFTSWLYYVYCSRGVGAEETILKVPLFICNHSCWRWVSPVQSDTGTYWRILACKEDEGYSISKREAHEEHKMILRAAVGQHVNMQQILNLVLFHPRQ